jgi:hypothetical protein
MDQLNLFKLGEDIKDRFTIICKNRPDLAVSHEAIDHGAGLLARVIDNFIDKNKENPKEGYTYLMDTLGFYIMLGADMQRTNEELLALLEEFARDKNE